MTSIASLNHELKEIPDIPSSAAVLTCHETLHKFIIPATGIKIFTLLK